MSTPQAGLMACELGEIRLVSDFAHEDPWCGHRLSRPKSRAAYASLGHSKHPAGVRDQNRTLSAFSVEWCPPSRRNAVRDGVEYAAEFIADEIEAILRDPKLRNRTLGVVSLLGPDQAKYIYNLVVGRVDVSELERRKFACGDAYVFQGSERDIMFLSMVADHSKHHALSGQLFEQRFNVAASRARDRMYLVRSVKLGEL